MPGLSVEEFCLGQANLELIGGRSGGVTVVDEGDAMRSRDVAVLPICPHAHEELDVVQGPGAAL